MTIRRKSTEPACRVCACTEHNACDEGCSWVKVGKREEPLCSACSGTAADLIQVLTKVRSTLGKLVPFSVDPHHTIKVMRSALAGVSARAKARIKAENKNPDKSWGGR